MRLVREHIYERFTQYSDPIRDLNIGSRPYLQKIWKAEYEKIGPENPYVTYKKYFTKSDDITYIRLVIMGIYIAFRELKDTTVVDDNIAYNRAIKYLEKYYAPSIEMLDKVKKQIKNFLNKKFYTNITI